jgi:8-oxo-dGTP pyrophosphatase MutT (NUDIX family)
MLSFNNIQSMLDAHQPVLLAADPRTHAAVALILRVAPAGPEVLFIERASHDGDPWSGDLGFPGGKVEQHDGEDRQTAERETLEEIGLNLGTARYFGRLSDIAGAHFPVRVSCFVFGVAGPTTFRLSDEVRNTFWFPLNKLLDPERHLTAPVHFSGRTLTSPAIRIMEPGNTPLWGITYRLVMQFLAILGFSPSPIPSPSGFSGDTPEK